MEMEYRPQTISKKTGCMDRLKCHPCVAGCVVIVIMLFSWYHGNNVKQFLNNLFNMTDENALMKTSDKSIVAVKLPFRPHLFKHNHSDINPITNRIAD